MNDIYKDEIWRPTKTCTSCLREKYLVEFPLHRRAMYGVSAWCNACHVSYRAKHPPKKYVLTPEALEIKRAKQREYHRRRRQSVLQRKLPVVDRLLEGVSKKELVQTKRRWAARGY